MRKGEKHQLKGILLHEVNYERKYSINASQQTPELREVQLQQVVVEDA